MNVALSFDSPFVLGPAFAIELSRSMLFSSRVDTLRMHVYAQEERPVVLAGEVLVGELLMSIWMHEMYEGGGEEVEREMVVVETRKIGKSKVMTTWKGRREGKGG